MLYYVGQFCCDYVKDWLKTAGIIRIISHHQMGELNMGIIIEHHNNRVVNQMLQIIRSEYLNGITLNEVALKLNMTPEYLSTLFYREAGIHFTEYLTQYRIEKAKVLLEDTQLTLREIARLTGFESPKYYSRVFKKVTGDLPSNYRSRVKKIS
jgi:two-component system response regulator YesN